MTRLHLTLIALAASAWLSPAVAQEVVRHRNFYSDSPISQAIEVPDGRAIVFMSSLVPEVADKNAHTHAAFGDTKAQTISVLKKMEDALARLALTHADVVQMNVFLVGDPKKGNRMDFAGFMDAYKQFYGTPAQPNLPARSVIQVAGLINPGWFVQIEVTAVRPGPR